MLLQEQTVIRQSDTAVKISNVSKIFEQWQRSGQGKNIIRNLIKPEKKRITALGNVSLSIQKGEFLAYAGPNGAGKSTTMKLLCGMLYPTEGEIEVLGLSPKKNRIELMKRVGVLFGNRTELWWDHPIISSFEWKRVVWDIPRQEYLKTKDKVIELLDIGDIIHTFARELSLGQRMRADLAMMLLHKPELILLDEPTLGLDVLAKRRMIQFLKELNREYGTTVVVTSHDMDDLEEMARRILLIAEGKITFDGSFEQLRKRVGGKCHVIITMEQGRKPQLNLGNLVCENNGVYEIEVDMVQTPIKAILSQISSMDGVSDIEFKKAPIEQVIAEIYSSWKK